MLPILGVFASVFVIVEEVSQGQGLSLNPARLTGNNLIGLMLFGAAKPPKNGLLQHRNAIDIRARYPRLGIPRPNTQIGELYIIVNGQVRDVHLPHIEWR